MKNEIEIKKHIKNISDITNNQYDIQIQVILDYYKNNIKCNKQTKKSKRTLTSWCRW